MLRNRLWLSFILLIIAAFAAVGTASASETGKTPAGEGEQPWMVGLVDSSSSNAKDGHFCGGSLIAPNWVLTAAHCVEGIQSASEVDLVIGRHTLSSNEGERITAAEIAVHKGYPDYADGQDNDIALIRLSRPATQGTPIQLINGTQSPADDAGSIARVTGWGVLSENGENSPDTLHGVNVPVVSQEACKAVYGSDLTDDTICAGKETGGADSCYGDSGGPLVGKDSNGNPVQIGVVSWGEECGASGQYGVYAQVTSYNNWIQNVMNGTADTLTPAELPASEEGGDWEDGDWEDGDWEDFDGEGFDWEDGDWEDFDGEGFDDENGNWEDIDWEDGNWEDFDDDSWFDDQDFGNDGWFDDEGSFDNDNSWTTFEDSNGDGIYQYEDSINNGWFDDEGDFDDGEW